MFIIPRFMKQSESEGEWIRGENAYFFHDTKNSDYVCRDLRPERHAVTRDWIVE